MDREITAGAEIPPPPVLRDDRPLRSPDRPAPYPSGAGGPGEAGPLASPRYGPGQAWLERGAALSRTARDASYEGDSASSAGTVTPRIAVRQQVRPPMVPM